LKAGLREKRRIPAEAGVTKDGFFVPPTPVGFGDTALTSKNQFCNNNAKETTKESYGLRMVFRSAHIRL
jgi:hypothetical protein